MYRPFLALACAASAWIPSSTVAAAGLQEEAASRPKIAVIGSSVAAGWVTGREAPNDLQNGWAARLQRLLEPRGRSLVNVSVPGDDTQAVLGRLGDDLLSLEPRYAIIGLSMANEGLETKDPGEVFESYEAGIAKILERCRERGVQPVVGLCYPNDNFGAEQYAALERMNLLLQSRPVPCIDFLGPLDDGHGNFIRGYTFDLDHPDDVGHQEMFHAIVPSLFDALDAGKPAPTRAVGEGHLTVAGPRKTAPVLHVPQDVMHSFSLSFQARTRDDGILAAVACGDTELRLGLDARGRAWLGVGPTMLETQARIGDGGWHDLAVVHRHLRGETELWIDGVSAGRLAGALVPRLFALGGPATSGKETPPRSADYRDLSIHRTAWTARAVAAHRAGAMLPASLEVYAPLRSDAPQPGGAFANLAQSTAEVHLAPADLSAALAQLEERIEAAAAEPRWTDPERVEPIALDPRVLARYVGDYAVNEQMTIFVTLEKGRLILSPNGEGKSELHQASETEFFLRVMGPPRIPVVFVLDESGEVRELLFDEEPYRLRARRVDAGD